MLYSILTKLWTIFRDTSEVGEVDRLSETVNPLGVWETETPHASPTSAPFAPLGKPRPWGGRWRFYTPFAPLGLRPWGGYGVSRLSCIFACQS